MVQDVDQFIGWERTTEQVALTDVATQLFVLVLTLLLMPSTTPAEQPPLPIIDMHLHASSLDDFGGGVSQEDGDRDGAGDVCDDADLRLFLDFEGSDLASALVDRSAYGNDAFRGVGVAHDPAAGTVELSAANSSLDLPVNIGPDRTGAITFGYRLRAMAGAENAVAVKFFHEDGDLDRGLVSQIQSPGVFATWAHTGTTFVGGTQASGWSFIAVRYDGSQVVLDRDQSRSAATDTTDEILAGDGTRAGGEYFARIKSLLGTAGWEIDDVFVYYDALTDAQIEFIRTQGAAALACASFDQDQDGYLGCASAPYQDTCLTSPNAALPSAITNLQLSHDEVTGETTLSWDPITDPGVSAGLVYDTFRSRTPNGFRSASCVATQQTANQAIDSITPALGEANYFLVRAANLCGLGAVVSGTGGVQQSLPTTCIPNVLVNGNMEDWTTPTDLVVWEENTSGGSIDQETDPAQVVEGSFAARLTRTSTGVLAILERNLPLTPGQDYTMSFTARFDRIESNAVQVRILNLTTGEDLQSDGSWAVGGHSFNFALTTSYQVFSIPFTVDPGFAPTDDIRVALRHRFSSAVGTVLWLDDVRIEE